MPSLRKSQEDTRQRVSDLSCVIVPLLKRWTRLHTHKTPRVAGATSVNIRSVRISRTS